MDSQKRRVEDLREEILASDFPNSGKEIDIKSQEAQRVPNMMNQKKTLRNIIIKMWKYKKRILKVATEKQLVGTLVRWADFSWETSGEKAQYIGTPHFLFVYLSFTNTVFFPPTEGWWQPELTKYTGQKVKWATAHFMSLYHVLVILTVF